MSTAESQTDGGGDDGSYSGTDDEIIQCHPSDHIASDSVAFSPDDKLVSYLVTPESTLGTCIFGFDLGLLEQRLLLKLPDGEVEEAAEGPSPTEKNRRKSLGDRGLGFTRYEWAQGASGPTLMVPLPGGLYVQDLESGELRVRVGSTASSSVLDPQLSPDGCSIAYVRDDEIYVIPTTSGEEIQVTSGARETGKTNGIAERLGPGETERRPVFCWSPDCKHIAFSEVDAAGVSSSPTVHVGENGDGSQAINADPSSTEANGPIRLGIVPATGGEVNWVQLLIGGTEHDNEEYLARVMWLPDGYLIAEIQNCAHTKAKLVKVNPSSGKCQVLVDERIASPILPDCFTPLKTGGFIWASGRSGFRHLYLYDAAGECLGPLTAGNWIVEQVAGVDENTGIIYFMGNSGPLETHLYSTLIFPDYSFPIEDPKQLTKGQGRHIVVLDHRKEKFVDILPARVDSPPRVQVCSLSSRRVIARQMPVIAVADLEPTSTHELHTVTLQPPSHDFGLEEKALEELQKAASILLKHSSILCEGLCPGCSPVLEQLLARLALFDAAETTLGHSVIEDGTSNHSDVEDATTNHSDVEDEVQGEVFSSDTNGTRVPIVSETLVGEHPQQGTVNGAENGTENGAENGIQNGAENGIQNATENATENGAENGTENGTKNGGAVSPDMNGDRNDKVSEIKGGDVPQPGTVNDSGAVEDTASGGVTPVSDGHSASTAGRRAKSRLWSEEQSSGSDVDDGLPVPLEDPHGDPEPPQTPAAAPEQTQGRIPKSAPGRIQSKADNGRVLSFHSPNAIPNYAWANATLPSPKQGLEEELLTSSAAEENGKAEVESPSIVPKRPRKEQEAIRIKALVRKKDFQCIERIRGGRLTNVVEGLELHKLVFNKVEQKKLVDMVYEFQELGRQGKLRGRTYSEPKKWMPGKGRITIQFGCCYNYALDKNGNPPGITQEHVDPLPDLLKTTIRRLVRWGVLDEMVVPDSCIINIYDVGDCIPPHIDHHDFVRPFSTLSLLSECNIVFGSKLSIVGDGLFDGPMSLPLPTGSVLVLKGNAADVAKHAVPGVPTRRISITFRKMDPLKAPSWYELPSDLRNIRTAPHLR